MLEELRSNPRSRAARSERRCVGAAAAVADGEVELSLSTGFARRPRERSTGGEQPIHRGMGWLQKAKEEVA